MSTDYCQRCGHPPDAHTEFECRYHDADGPCWCQGFVGVVESDDDLIWDEDDDYDEADEGLSTWR